MLKPNIYVVKFGGSILSGPSFGDWVEVLLNWSSGKEVYVVPGGGAMANTIRELQGSTAMSDVTAHQLAITSMRQLGAVICEATDSCFKWINLSECKIATNSEGRFLWTPDESEYDVSGMPKDWSVTSDSIALWFANYIGARELILLKSIAPPASCASSWSQAGYVDDYFAKLLVGASCPVRAVWALDGL